jgi:epoxyqueuosine reductase
MSKGELDYWDGKPGRTPGIRKLLKIGKVLKLWLKDKYDIDAKVLSYSVSRGGIFLKDAAVLAGLGVLGKNNLLITPEYGPLFRLSALSLNERLESTGPIEFAPCDECDMPCRTACPQEAFREGFYDMPSCRKQMNIDEKNAVKGILEGVVIKYCRECELACPVGK